MAMTPLEMIEFFGKAFEGSQNGINIGKSKSNYQLVALNYRQSFKSKLMQGLISWRIESENPKQHIIGAVNVANEAVIELKSLGSKNLADDFAIDTASILSLLAGKDFKMPEFSTKGIVFDRLLDFELAKSLQGKNNQTEWLNVLKGQKPTKRINLCLETYSTYHELLFNKDITKTEELVRKAEELFLKRLNDAFFTGSESTESGGLNNNVTVDYRLGAILKFIGYKGQSMHLWRWD